MEKIIRRAEIIESDYLPEDIDIPFRVFAGPGAGKTHWLVNYIKHVISTSDRLGPSQRIACISYTTVAADEIQRRLGSSSAHVMVSTIHSFLYRNIVKPYLPWLEDDNGEPLVSYQEVDGHRPHRAYVGTVNEWIREVSDMDLFRYKEKKGAILEYMSNLYWMWYPEVANFKIKDQGYPPAKYFPSSEENLRLYKKKCWSQRRIDHEDVLYFALKTLVEKPVLVKFLSSRFPYVFIDEFQDTTPIQTEIIKKLAEAGSVTGIIGDPEQSIFRFAGANPKDFIDFELVDQESYQIQSNRRSSQSILKLLNEIRKSGNQSSHIGDNENNPGDPPVLIVGAPRRALERVRERSQSQITILTRSNDTRRRLIIAEDSEDVDHGVWDSLESADAEKTEWLQAILEATHEAQPEVPRYGQAVKILYRGLRTKRGRLLKSVFTKSGKRRLSREERRRAVASLLPTLLADHPIHLGMNGHEFYLALRDRMQRVLPDTPMVKVTKGGTFGKLLADVDYEALYLTTRLESGGGKIKTIHKSKGEEFPSVFVYRGSSDKWPDPTIDHILNRDSSGDDEERCVTYVAFSRAEEQLFICVDTLPDEDEEALIDLGLQVLRIDQTAQTQS
jgi:DNA helicase-2/ATP-dependent DNA helicase PcrA